ncbi:MAG: hypothetical protein JWR22_2860 [Herminiimonas sp.]|nr:hypothetical protein [Herminiimonas sp.]
MSTALATCTTQEPPSESLSLFNALLFKNNLDYGITWRWQRRCRHGIIEVYDVSFGPCDGVVESEAFERNTQLWEESDRVLGRMHSGSPKHRAVRALVARLQARSA